jgi:hypothetical protein
MPLHELIQRILSQQGCSDKACPFLMLQENIKRLSLLDDPVEVIADAVQYTEATSRTMVRVEAHALHKLLDRLVDAERRLTLVGKG